MVCIPTNTAPTVPSEPAEPVIRINQQGGGQFLTAIAFLAQSREIFLVGVAAKVQFGPVERQKRIGRKALLSCLASEFLDGLDQFGQSDPWSSPRKVDISYDPLSLSFGDFFS